MANECIQGTLCIRGTRQDYDDWDLPGWSGDEVFKYMSKAETFHNKPWFKADEKAHGYDGPLHTEPHDLAPISNLLLDSFQSQGMPLVPDMVSKLLSVSMRWEGLNVILSFVLGL